MAKQKKNLKKVNLYVWCSSCCQNVVANYPHTCYNYAEIVAKGIHTHVLSIKTGVKLIQGIAERTTYYRD